MQKGDPSVYEVKRHFFSSIFNKTHHLIATDKRVHTLRQRLNIEGNERVHRTRF
jgi:hypothetical protein